MKETEIELESDDYVEQSVLLEMGGRLINRPQALGREENLEKLSRGMFIKIASALMQSHIFCRPSLFPAEWLRSRTPLQQTLAGFASFSST